MTNVITGTTGTSFKIIKTETFDADEYGSGEHLTPLGGIGDYDGSLVGLGAWTLHITVEVTNQKNEIQEFLVAFQPENRLNDMQAYSGYGVHPASSFGYDADESNLLVEFCDYDDFVIDELYKVATDKAKDHLYHLKKKLEDGEVEVSNANFLE